MGRRISQDKASGLFNRAESILGRIPVDHGDPVYNLAAALDNFAGALGSMQSEIAASLDEIASRLERIENTLTTPMRRP